MHKQYRTLEKVIILQHEKHYLFPQINKTNKRLFKS